MGGVIAWKHVRRVVYKIVNKKDITTQKGSSIIVTLKASDDEIIKCYATSVIQSVLSEILRNNNKDKDKDNGKGNGTGNVSSSDSDIDSDSDSDSDNDNDNDNDVDI